MAAHTPSGRFNSNLDGAIGNTPTQTPPTFLNAPDFRTKVVQILAQTTNACLQELNLHPRMAQEITELKSRIDDYHTKNRKLYDDNKALLSMVREAHNKLGAYSATNLQLEQQATALHKANNEVLMRERSLAAGNPAYKQLQSEYMHLSSYCDQLKQQVVALQRIVEKPTLQHLPGPSRQPSVIAEGGQPLHIKQSAAHHTHEAVREPHEHPNRVQPQRSHSSTLGKDCPSQKVHSHSHPSVSRQSIVARPGPLKQPIQGNHPISVPPMYPSTQPKLPMTNNASQLSESSPSPSATHYSGAMRIRAPEAVGPVPRITGWMDRASPHGVVTRSPLQNHSPHAASALHGRSGSAQLHSSASFSTGLNVNLVPIGPPGKLLPPLTASVMKHSSPPSRPPSARASLPSDSMHMPEPAHAIKTNHPPLDTSMPAIGHSGTPNLTPTSSRNSVAPSEGELEATTPLDDHVNHTVKVVKSPVSEVGVESGVVVLEDAISASSLKRSSVDVRGDEGGNPSDVEESARKRLKLTEDVPSEGAAGAGETISTNSSLQVMDEDTGDDEEEDEFGPDGKLSLEYCLDVFTEEDGDVDVCALCRLRQKSGLISTPTVFPPNLTQKAKVQHFLDEHPTAWENMRNGRGCS